MASTERITSATQRTGSYTRSKTRRQQLPEEVATYVRELIISGEVKAGDYLRMEPIAEAVGVSNTPVREGLLMLKSEGFVRLVPRRGFVVAPFLADDIRDLFWAQAVLAGELAARAAERISDEGLDVLEGMIEQYEAAVKAGDSQAVADLGHLFHREINLAAQSNRLALLQGSVVKHLPTHFYAAVEGQISASRDGHPQILAALKARDPERAREAMARHITGAADRLIETLAQRGIWDDDNEAAARAAQ
ncbi:GntR family transcriptional regulator [Gulosibacter sp. ACHW.36C]|uniref:GntR family transcriptional regulator n=1 Tax=Gulosibacter sediminis TaxID=1729695 RepID=A0ABY4MW36_9MICO|nr:GntR family transcriptional regulator [Gulosibacter sediminis]UQN14646.1 GntR family transcriptional regulator [Gulosibacter sediminis]